MTGITSTSIYTSPTSPMNRRYVLCTTSPSSERHYNSGEWSFSLPLPSPSSPTPRWRPPSNIIHDFEQFQHHRPIRAGAVSDNHNIFAVLEDNGRISTLALTAGSPGGVCGLSDESKELTFLDKSIGAIGGCLRFTPDGERLVAADAKGKIVIAGFEKV